ncbi:pilus assembly protein [Pseudomonas sp. MAG002Y]|uniref:pilus assembly protein n=1 Tax=Pseudomonas sp. MAG002Y TaxID=2678690 RepID=UPI001C60F5E6|nr:PilC/PilY family type IV pilus protein [Pseudomonas sp. MAG002Y]MBW5411705.1 pilus assembly protein PilC [Pseudomonas sp. MAG002Y]
MLTHKEIIAIMTPLKNNYSIFKSFALVAFASFTATSVYAEVSQTPLLLGSGNVPGSLALVPSVEWPTVLSVANLGSYNSANEYSGYFDSNKCYLYNKTSNDGWFYPNGLATNHKCNGKWSGNFLNWAATPTIDPFRSALTGGLRAVDQENLTILQKARHSGQNSTGDRTNSGQGMIPAAEFSGATPVSSGWNSMYIRLSGLNTDMVFSNWSDKLGDDPTSRSEWIDYDPNNSAQLNNGRLIPSYRVNENGGSQVKSVYRLRIQVKVCDPSPAAGGLESNCKRYSSTNYKPEGLLQQYSDTLRYSVFGYLNDSSEGRDGGVLRANQKGIGPKDTDGSTNPYAEWNATTGILVKNPNPADAISTGNGVADSGVINYLNKFASMPYQTNPVAYKAIKSLDPVSELYYAAIRYFKNQGNVPAYSNLTGGTQAERYAQADGFPVITNWQDPINYSCQKNVILGIGDTNTHRDKNLPGPTSSVGEVSPKPPEVVADTTVNVVTATAKVGSLEGVNLKETSSSYTGRSNSAYIAGLAYDSHTVDLRPNMSGKQTLSTYWVDVRENQSLAGRASNQYWLAAKYGGFKVPSNFSPYSNETNSATITDDLWWTNGEILPTGDKRPDNFFVASDAANMTASLKTAFSQIVKEVRSTSTSLATNSTQLNTESAVFQTLYNSSNWSGDLLAKTVSGSGSVAATPTWSAASKLDALTNLSTRKIFLSNGFTAREQGVYSTSIGGIDFFWNNNLDNDAKIALQTPRANGVTVEGDTGQNRLNYLRGERNLEKTKTTPSNPFRSRGSRLGDIINSDPQYVSNQDYGYNLLTGSMWGGAGSSYLSFRRSTDYINRKPMVVVGTNDGMLHGFDATVSSIGGGELFAYIPRSITGDLYKLTDPNYSHQYYVDGSPTSSDAWINGSWKTIVVGTTGAGGKSVFALDATNPNTMSARSVMWEFTAPDMSYPVQKPSVVALANGKFGVIVSSGFTNSSVTKGHVWVLDAANGNVLKKFTVNTTGGMAQPLAIDINNDRVADRIYVGDTQGNLWRFDITGEDVSKWDGFRNGNQNIIPIFSARDSSGRVQPITAPLTAALNTDGKPIILFGTGSFYQTVDTDLLQNQRIESYYAIIDRDSSVNRTNLAERKILKEVNVNGQKGRILSEAATGDMYGKSGWVLDLLWKASEGGSNSLTGERVVSAGVLRNGTITFSTLTPSDDPCSGGATSWVMSLDVFTGARLAYNYFDFNGDGLINDNDYFTDSNGNKIPFSGISNPDLGAIDTPSYFNGNATNEGSTDLICFAGSANADQPVCSPAPPGSRTSDRVSWREIR